MTNNGLIFLIDQDGPLANFDKQFYDLCSNHDLPMHGGGVSFEAPCTEHRFATDCIDSRDGRATARKFVDTTTWFRSLPVVEGAVEGINKLREHPEVAEVFICTKPLEVNATCRDDKAAWIEQHLGMSWVKRTIITPHKGMVKGDVLLDDAPKAQWYDIAEWVPAVFRMPWNEPGSAYSTKMNADTALRWSWEDDIETLIDYAYRGREMFTP